MKFILLYIRKNIRRRTSSYVLPFVACLLSGLLLCTSVFYLTLEKSHDDLRSAVPHNIAVLSYSRETDDLIAASYGTSPDLVYRHTQECVDIFPIYRDDIAEFDEGARTRIHRLYFATLDEYSTLADFYLDHGYDVAALGPHDIFVSQYAYYWFQDRIENDVLTLDGLYDESGEALRLNIVGTFDKELSDDGAFMLISSNVELLSALRSQLGASTSIHYYDFADTFVQTRDNTTALLTGIRVAGVDTRIHSDSKAIDGGGIYSGDIAIALFNIFFAVICMASTLVLKVGREVGDYKKLRALGMSPIMLYTMPLIDSLMIGLPAYAVSFVASVALFSVYSPKNLPEFQSGVIINLFEYSHRLLFLTLALFVGLLILISSAIILLRIVRPPKVYRSFVRSSSRLYYSARSFTIPYNLLRFRRNKRYGVFMVLIVCLPMFVIGMYGTSAASSGSKAWEPFSDATFHISRHTLHYGSEIVDRIVGDIQTLDGVESVQVIHKTTVEYTLTHGETATSAQFVEWTDYVRSQVERYLADGSLDDIVGSDRIVVVDNNAQFEVGQTLKVGETGQMFTVGAILRNMPMTYSRPTVYADMELLDSLGQADILPYELYVLTSDDMTDLEYAVLKARIPSMIYDPYTSFSNQKDNAESIDVSNIIVVKAANTMNLLIGIIAVLTIFLLHAQHHLARKDELDVLYRIGYSRGQVSRLVYLESYTYVALGLAIFALLYGTYIGITVAAIREAQAYEFMGFVLAWREIVPVALGMLAAVGLSCRISTASPHQRRKKHEDHRIIVN